MSTTLTNGLKLPDKGSVDWYADMQNNYTILDGAVGTVAEHTTALAGKASAVHTHTKSDVTDLLNSNFIPGANNSYDLGSSSYQWNNLYAKNYYYNGVAWGLDKSNVWSQVQTISYSGVPTIRYIHPSLDIGSAPASDCGMQLNFCDADTNVVSAFQYIKGSGVNRISIALSTKNSTNQIVGKTLRLQTNQEGTTWDFYPSSNKEINLGTPTNKWKTLNGINPGALSLPDTTREEPIDTTNWVYTYTAPNVYYPPEDGWLAIACSGSDYIQIDGNAGWGITLSKGYDGYCTGILPVKKNVRVQIRIKETSSGSVVVRKASFYPGTGDPSFTVTPLNNS